MGVDKKPSPVNPDTSNNQDDSTAQRIISFDPEGLPIQTVVIPADHEMRKWLRDDSWPQLEWLKPSKANKGKVKGFENYYINSLRSRYLKLEGDFRSVFNNYFNSTYMDFVAAKLIIGYLQMSRESLEHKDCDVTNVITMLDLADQSMVALYPPHYAKAQMSGMASELKGSPDPATQAWGIYLEKELIKDGQTLGGLRAALDKTKEAINAAKQGSIISTGLQIERLGLARKWSWYVLGICLIFLPFVIKIDAKFWEDAQLFKSMPISTVAFPWILMITAGAFGAVGAFFSNLLSIQKTRSQLTDFQESLKNNLLKLNIGALAAMIMFSFLTWQIIPGVELKNAGSLIFLAFIAGFSERYFLDLLSIKDNDIAPRPAPADVVAAPLSSTEGVGNVNAEKVNQ